MPDARVLLIPEGHEFTPLSFNAKIDGYTRRSHKLATSVSAIPLENGAEVNDHSIQKPEEINLTGKVTDFGESRAEYTDAYIHPQVNRATAITTRDIRERINEQNTKRIQEGWSALRDFERSSTIFQLITPWHVFEEVIIVELTGDESGSSLDFKLKLREVFRVGISTGVTRSNSVIARFSREPPALPEQIGVSVYRAQMQSAVLRRLSAEKHGLLQGLPLAAGSFFRLVL